MNIDEFEARLNPKNKYRDELLFAVKGRVRDGTVLFPRDSKLFESVAALCERKLYPVVDRVTSTVFGTVSHNLIRVELYRYVYYAEGFDKVRLSADACADLYLTKGHGWFISGVRPKVVVMGKAYVPDEVDRPVLELFTIDQDPSLEAQVDALIFGRRL